MGLQTIAQVSLLPLAHIIAQIHAKIFGKATFIWDVKKGGYVGGYEP